MKAKTVITIVISMTMTLWVLSAWAQSGSRNRAQASATRSTSSAQGMEREARRLADHFWRGLTKCGRSYFLYADDRLFEFRDSPHFTFYGEALKPKPLSRVDVLNGADPLPVEWDGGTNVSFEVCRMNTSHSELPGAYGNGRTLWDGWRNWTSQHCEFGTRIRRAKGKWTVSALKQISCADLASWGLTAKPRSTKSMTSSNSATTHTRLDSNPALASYVVLGIGTTKEKVRNSIVEQTIAITRKRLELAGVSAFKVERERDSTPSIVVKLAPLQDPQRVKHLISTGGRLEIVHLITIPSNPTFPQIYATREEAIRSLGGTVSPNRRVLEYVSNFEREGTIEQRIQWAIAESPEIVGATGWRECQVVSIQPDENANVVCSLNDVGTQALAAWTRANINQTAGLVLDGRVIAHYLIQYETGAGLQFRLASDVAENLAITSKSGPLPAAVSFYAEGTLRSFRKF